MSAKLWIVAGILLAGVVLFFVLRRTTSRIVSVPVTRDEAVMKPGDKGRQKVAVISDRVARWDGIYYWLPKTFLQFTVKYNLWVEDARPEPATTAAASETSREPNNADTRYGILLLDEAGLTVTPVFRRDPKQNYLLTSLDVGRTQISDYKVALSEDGFLTTVNATYEDKTSEIVSNVVIPVISLVTQLAPVAIKAPKIRALRDFKKTAKSFTFTMTVAAEKLISEEAIFSGELVALATGEEVPIDIKVAYRNFRWLGKDMKDEVQKYQKALTAVLDSTERTETPDAVKVAKQLGGDSLNIPGVVYRTPLQASVVLKTGNIRVAELKVDVYQFGLIGYKEVRSWGFSKRTEKLTFNNGNLTQHEKSATSAAANVTKLVSDQLSSLKTAIDDIKGARTTAATARLTRERDLEVKRIELDTVNRKLELNQQKIDRATTPGEKETALSERDSLLKQKISLEAEINALRQGMTVSSGS
jgi:hypothetical protein